VIAGPFSLQYLHLFVSRKSPGAFILSKKGRAADFVGASTEDVGVTIRQFAKQSPYRYFWYVYTESAEDAFHIEMAWYHRYRPTDNQAAPWSPADDWRCTTAGCATCALAYSPR
jgi:hypothetical protein